MHYIWILILTAFWTIILGFIGILFSLFETKKGSSLGALARIWAKLILFFSRVSYSVTGLDNLELNKNYIFAGNHASGLDILLAFGGLPFWLVSIAKKELRSIPILGFVMSKAGHIFVDRKNRERALESLEQAKESLKETPRSVLLFPEGTRTRDGSLGPFKKGGLLLGVETGIPIVPIAFCKTFEALDKGTFRMNNQPIELRIGSPISSDNYSFESRKELATIIRNEVKKLLNN